MRRGPLYMILASGMFTAMVAMVKVGRAEMSPLELVFWRALVSVPLVLMTLRGVGFRLRARGAFAARLLLGVAAMTCFYTAALELDVVDLNLISRFQPILVAVLAPLVLGPQERPGPLVWAAAAAGLVGCGIILAPDLAVGSLAGVWAFAATFLSAGAHLSLRRVASVDPGRTIVFWFHSGMLALALAALTVDEGGVPAPPRALWPVLAGIGITATAGQLLVTRAYSLDRAPVVAAASYFGVLWALIADALVFGRWPSASAIFGGTLVVTASLALVLRERPAAGRRDGRADPDAPPGKRT
jgi:drug/metabolite transporter (DMT)-like permease